MATTYNTYCPMFEGFYGTKFEYDREEFDIEEYNQEHGTDYDWDDFDWNYEDFRTRVARSYVSSMEHELKQFLPTLTMDFEGVLSPREYNFRNDSINVKVQVNLDMLIDLLTQPERLLIVTEYIREKYTSRSGFISFHSNRVSDWMDIKYILEEPEHRVGGLLDMLCHCEINDDDTYEWCSDEFWVYFSPNKEEESK